MCCPAARVRGGGGEGLRQYYLQHIHDHQLQIRQKTNNLQRLEAQRNDLNSRGSDGDESDRYSGPSTPPAWYLLGPAVCTEAGMFALRERRVHVTQEDFEMAVAKVMKKETEKNMSLRKLWK
ncbi:hypothetical protein BHE74_00035694 [Ensete ventricosum]|nr:hypothetical protein BHE74_00035694 [Ensete ventricosum]